MQGFNLAKSVVGLIGNVSSTVGAGFIVLCYVFLLPVNGHFRHSMILNLAVADFMNAAIGTFNQSYLLHTGVTFPSGRACTGIGAIVQLSVQAIDVSILAIAIVTYLGITRPSIFDSWSRVVVVAGIWALPVVTSIIGVAKHYYRPATGGWCWISAKPPHLRYVLTHGWRFLFIALIVVIYVKLYFYLRQNYRLDEDGHNSWLRKLKSWRTIVSVRSVGGGSMGLAEQHGGARSAERGSVERLEPAPVKRHSTLKRVRDEIKRTHAVEYEQQLAKIKKALLLRAYPTCYVLLWIPGIANRLVEASGKISPPWLILLQASTSYIGLANAITYGWNEGIARELRRKWDRSRRGSSVGPLEYNGGWMG